MNILQWPSEYSDFFQTSAQKFRAVPKSLQILTFSWFVFAVVGFISLAIALWLYGSPAPAPASQGSIEWCVLSDASPEQTPASASELYIHIYISGGVEKPGVYRLPANSRVVDAIEQAGGFSKKADGYIVSKELNGAAPLSDGQHVYVPVVADREFGSVATAASTAGSGSASQPATVSVNSASLEELDALPGIGPTRAQDIIASRPYQSIEELVTKSVISQSLFDSLRGKISL